MVLIRNTNGDRKMEIGTLDELLEDSYAVHKAKLNSMYPFIRIWGHKMGSYSDYIVEQQEKALQDNAPFDVIYKNSMNNTWSFMQQYQTHDEPYRMQEKIEFYERAMILKTNADNILREAEEKKGEKK